MIHNGLLGLNITLTDRDIYPFIHFEDSNGTINGQVHLRAFYQLCTVAIALFKDTFDDIYQTSKLNKGFPKKT